MYAIEIKPAIEWIHGRVEQKVTPQRRHAILQARLVGILALCAGSRGDVGTEWRFFFPDIPEKTTLVPDVAYVSYDRLRTLDDDSAERPPFAPDVAIDIRSPSSRFAIIAEKIEIYLAYGSILVLDVDAENKSVTAHTPAGVTVYATGTFRSDAVPWFAFDVDALFSGLEIPR